MDFMRLGILTLFTGYNEGAILQALASVRILRSLFDGAAVEIIDQRFSSLEDGVYGPPKNPRQRALVDFVENALPRSREKFKSRCGLDSASYIQKEYDVVLVGADEVWKVNFKKYFRGLLKLQRDPWSPPFPNAFWCPNLDSRVRRIAHAASIGAKTQWRSFPKSVRIAVGDAIRAFDCLSVRDLRSLKMIEELAPDAVSPAVIVQDPAFALGRIEVEGSHIEQVAAASRGRPTAAIVVRNDPRVRQVIGRLRDQGVFTFSLSEKNSDVDMDLSEAAISPLQWATLLQRSHLVVTERMHGAILALGGGTPVVGLDFRRRVYDLPTKMEEVLRRFPEHSVHFNLCSDGEDVAEALSDRLPTLLNSKAEASSVLDEIARGEALRAEFLRKALVGILHA